MPTTSMQTATGQNPERNIRRMSGEQEIVVKATDACSKAEWAMLLEAMSLGRAERSSSYERARDLR